MKKRVLNNGGTDHLVDQGIDGRIILRLNFRKWDVGGYGLDRAGLA